MRTRDAKLTDYNVPKEDEEKLDEYCKKTDSDLRFILLGCCPWNTNHRLVRIGLKAKEIPTDNLPASNLVFLIVHSESG